MSATPPFAALATAPGLARGHVRATLAGWGLGELAEAAELIASEMTANAVNAISCAGSGSLGDVLVIRLCRRTHGAVLTIECWDQAPGVPVLRAASGLTETVRGLAIINSRDERSVGLPSCHRPERQMRLARDPGTRRARLSAPGLSRP